MATRRDYILISRTLARVVKGVRKLPPGEAQAGALAALREFAEALAAELSQASAEFNVEQFMRDSHVEMGDNNDR